jgi:uncharacterized protein (DUF1330 family)
MKKGYWVVTYRSVSDPNRLLEYGKLAGPAVQAAGGRPLVRGAENVEPHESGVAQRVVVIEFESWEKAKAAYRTDDYEKAKVVLGDAVVRDFRIVEGLE